MNKEKIAILVDSGADVPKKLLDEYNMYVARLKILYKDGEYRDGSEISAEDVYRRLEEEIPKTSLPSGKDIHELFEQIKKDGYEKVIAVTISSGLSGTHNAIRIAANEMKDLEIYVLDTKNIAIASGYSAILAGEYINEGLSFESIIEKLEKNIFNSKVFFTVDTLEYLQKGGRIGLVSSIIGKRINLKPTISCNEDGIYYTVAKNIGRRRSLKKTLDLVLEFVGDHKDYNLGVVHGDAEEEAENLKEKLIEKLPDYNIFVDGQISPALGVHTGPGTIGIVAQKI